MKDKYIGVILGLNYKGKSINLEYNGAKITITKMTLSDVEKNKRKIQKLLDDKVLNGKKAFSNQEEKNCFIDSCVFFGCFIKIDCLGAKKFVSPYDVINNLVNFFIILSGKNCFTSSFLVRIFNKKLRLWGDLEKDMKYEDFIEESIISITKKWDNYLNIKNEVFFHKFLESSRNNRKVEDRTLDLATSLESMLSDNNEGISHKIALRLSCFVAKEPSIREFLFARIKDFYDIRSGLIHSNKITKKKIEKKAKDFYFELAEKYKIDSLKLATGLEIYNFCISEIIRKILLYFLKTGKALSPKDFDKYVFGLKSPGIISENDDCVKILREMFSETSI